MLLIGVVVVLAGLALITQVGVIVIQRMYRPPGQMIDVAGGRLHVVDIGPKDGRGPPLVLVHGASSNLEAMRQPLGDLLSKRHRVILIDRPGHGWSTRERLTDSTPAIQAAMIDEALGKLGVARAIFVVHSWAGALGPAMALDHPSRVAGLVMLAPVTHPWRGGVAWHHELGVKPLIGELFARTLALPIGLAIMDAGAGSVFLPQTMPPHYARDTATALLLRPSEFLTNAHDLSALKAAVAAQVSRYGEIKVPTVVISGDTDKTVYIDVHSRPFVAAVPNAKLVVLPGVGHMTQNAAPEIVIDAIDAMVDAMSPASQAVARER
ncbi:alpha/beta fold hydrolase [Bradyrhizobium prioriisuperbiae]|uniref:alpha/beta fold hydrolase n=1 Tax=Bradyrhizobium prioriisuperbiae TaxID=2854389 RepID=UPI00389905AA